jgi:D-serine dehydratase
MAERSAVNAVSGRIGLPPSVERSVTGMRPFLWLNEHWLPIEQAKLTSPLTLENVNKADARWQSFASLLANLFSDLAPSAGIIESALIPADGFQRMMTGASDLAGRWFIKGDHALPVAGSIKARGGIYEVLLHAEALALRAGFEQVRDDKVILATPPLRELFAQHRVAVGSTGNLGLSIGVMAAALGFQATVHMSSEAKDWKKERLRSRGVQVIEHKGDFGMAVAAGREQAALNPDTYFVDDENSRALFLGYSVAALRLRQQLTKRGIEVDARHPLFVYLPCGVGGAPGGITFGLRHLFGDNAHCFFAEPVATPCMLVRLALADDCSVSVREFGLNARTEADGLAVGRASDLVAPMMRALVSGIFTVPDEDLFEDLYALERSEGLRIEPSAAAGLRGPRWVLESEQGRHYLTERGLVENIADATHILWTTGGAFVPDEEYWKFHERGRMARKRHSENAFD